MATTTERITIPVNDWIDLNKTDPNVTLLLFDGGMVRLYAGTDKPALDVDTYWLAEGPAPSGRVSNRIGCVISDFTSVLWARADKADTSAIVVRGDGKVNLVSPLPA